MELVGIELERPPNIPCLLLREAEGDRRVLPIFIGGPEATAIVFALEDVETPRPMTHDLMKDLLDELGARIERIVVSDLRDSTFYADIVISIAGATHSVSARPSDAVALAVRYGAPVYAEEGVLAEASRAPGEGVPDEIVEQFKEFIEQVNPEDFAVLIGRGAQPDQGLVHMARALGGHVVAHGRHAVAGGVARVGGVVDGRAAGDARASCRRTRPG